MHIVFREQVIELSTTSDLKASGCMGCGETLLKNGCSSRFL